MIDIYRNTYDSPINHFHGRASVRRDEVVVKTKVVFGKEYTYAEPAVDGSWAFGGTILHTGNGIYPEFNTPIKLHDRNLLMESRAFEESTISLR